LGFGFGYKNFWVLGLGFGYNTQPNTQTPIFSGYKRLGIIKQINLTELLLESSNLNSETVVLNIY